MTCHTYPQSQPISTVQHSSSETHMCVVSFPVALRLATPASWLVPIGQAPWLPVPKPSDQSQEISDKLDNWKITGISGQPRARCIIPPN